VSTQPLASPLTWPARQPRTPSGQRRRNYMWKRATVTTASVQIEEDVRKLGGHDLVLSTNLALRIDGFPRSGQAEPEDSGAAVYFRRKGQPLVFACDRYVTVRENLRAIGMHLEAIRGQERWGVGTLDQAFAGYAALPAPGSDRSWWDALGLDRITASQLHQRPENERREILVARFRARAKEVHPDSGGTQEAFVELQRAYEEALRELGVA
jgi:hypothetical protein